MEHPQGSDLGLVVGGPSGVASGPSGAVVGGPSGPIAAGTFGVSERRLRALSTHFYDGIAVVDARRLVNFVSPSLCAILDRTVADVVDTPVMDFVEPVDGARLQALLADVEGGREIGPIQLRLRSGDGSWMPFEAYRTDLLDDPDVLGVVWSLRHVSESRQVERAQWQSDVRLHALAAGSSDVTVVNDHHGVAIYAGPSMERVFGYRTAEFVGSAYDAFVHPDDLAAVVATAGESLAAGRTTWSSRYRLRHADGTWRWVDTRFTDLQDDPAVGGVVANIRDVTDQTLSDRALAESESLYRSMVQTAEESITIHALDGRITFANPRMATLIGTTVAHLQRMSIFDLVDPELHDVARAKLARRHDGHAEHYEFGLRKVDGSCCDVLISASPLRDAAGTVTGVLSMMTDISDRKRSEAENLRLALEDSLTGVASRALVADRVTQLIARQHRDPGLAAVIFMDLDNFKAVNDSHGHSVGDKVLREVATRVRAAVRPQDTVGRYGGDEFVVILDRLDQLSDAAAVAERIVEALAVPVTVCGSLISATASLGIAMTPVDSADSLMRDADIAMYRAKERGGARYELFDSSLGSRMKDRLGLEADLRAAVAGGDLHLHYQPVVRLDGGLTGFEALARWDHPVRGAVPPAVFIPLAESTGIIVALGKWILDRACSDLARWRTRPGCADLTMAVNVSARQLVEVDIVGSVASALSANHLEPGALCLEITESVLMDDAVVAGSALTGIHDLGVRLAVDDFGTGYSSLLYLRRFPVDALKLDRLFVSGVAANPLDSTIVRSVIDLAHSLGLGAVAEGVETVEQLDALGAMGCDLAQGYYWSPGIPAAEVESLVSSPSSPGDRLRPPVVMAPR